MVTTGMPACDRLLDGRRQRVDVERRDDDGVDLLHDRRLDVGGLLGRRVLAVALDQVDALRLGLGLDLVEHVHEEREAEAGHRAQDGQLVLGEGAGRQRERAHGYGRHQKFTSVHRFILLPHERMNPKTGSGFPKIPASIQKWSVLERPRGRNGAPVGPPRRSPPLGAGGWMLAKAGDLRKNGRDSVSVGSPACFLAAWRGSPDCPGMISQLATAGFLTPDLSADSDSKVIDPNTTAAPTAPIGNSRSPRNMAAPIAPNTLSALTITAAWLAEVKR